MEPIVCLLLGAAVVVFIAAALAGWTPLLRTASLGQPEEATDTPKLSVVVYAPSAEPEIGEWLDAVMNQDYPDYEVIVVAQASAEGTRMIADHFQAYHDRLRFTFINPEARGLSRRKLALTLGIKAAKGNVVLTTSTSVGIPSSRWLSEMAAPFAHEATALSLGTVRPDFQNMGSLVALYRKYLWVTTTSRWISAALRNRPYRGQGDNLAFRRQTFFDHKGYADSLLLKCGDDDIFVNSISGDGTAAVVVSPDSILQETSGPEASLRWQDNREQHRFTSRFLPSASAYRAGFASACRWAGSGCCVAAGAISPTPINLAVSGGLLLIFWIVEASVYSRASQRLLTPGAALLAPFFNLWHPIGNLFFGMRCRSRRCINYS